MSIANNSLLRRILAEVRDGRAPGGLAAGERSEAGGQLLEFRCTEAVHAPPFATPLHFWAHALRAFLEDRGRSELFEALAANCLCEAIPGESVEGTLAELAGRLSPTHRLPARATLAVAPYLGAYRMIDQPVIVSWVAERRHEFVAVFWAQCDWITSARPLDLE